MLTGKKKRGMVLSLALMAISTLLTVESVKAAEESEAKDAETSESQEAEMVEAGMVVSVSEDFLTRGSGELLREFVARLNRVGELVEHTIDLSEYENVPTDGLPGTILTMS